MTTNTDTDGPHDPSRASGQQERAELRRQALSIAVALVPFGLAFGVLCAEVGLVWWQALGFSSLVFSGSAQFAAVGVLGEGGAGLAAVGAGLLLNLRSLAFGVAMAPALRGRLPFRLVASQLMIDEAMAVGSGPTEPALRRYGYFAGGLAVFVLWNASTLVGVLALDGAGDLVERLGIDATIPAAFLALLWPRLAHAPQRRAALAGVVVALVAVPFVPIGVPILLAAAGVLAGRPVSGRAERGAA
jgi:predicted branched-subunit amino acid permease